jgi:Ca2+-binding RTX toxin-like protein
MGNYPLVRKAALLMAVALVGTMLLASAAYAKNVVGKNVSDNILGTAGKDVLYGLSGNDTIDGRAGADDIYGGKGNDNLWGYGGADYINGGRGNDFIVGKWGNDRIEAADGHVDDLVNCGAGDEDRASVDAGLDTVVNCEFVTGRRR